MTVILGDIAATETADGADGVALSYRMTAEASMWIAVRAWGARGGRLTRQGCCRARGTDRYDQLVIPISMTSIAL